MFQRGHSHISKMKGQSHTGVGEHRGGREKAEGREGGRGEGERECREVTKRESVEGESEGEREKAKREGVRARGGRRRARRERMQGKTGVKEREGGRK